MCVQGMDDIWSQMKTVDPVTHGIAEEVMKRDSQAVEGIARKMGWGRIAEEADYNQRNQGEGIAKASLFAAPFLTGGASGLLAGAGAAGEAASAGMTAQEILEAEQALQAAGAATEAAGVSSPGLLGANTAMESALADTGYTPSNLLEAFKNASETNNTPLAKNLENYGKGLLQNAQTPGGQERLGKAAFNQGKGMLQQPQQPQYQPPPQKPQQTDNSPLPLPYGNNTQGYQEGLLGMSEEEKKKRLRAMGYRV